MGECRADGRRGNVILSKKYITNYFNPCCARPSNARFVIFFTFTVYFNPCCVRPSNARIVTVFTVAVADAAGAATLRFKRIGLSHETNIRIPKIPPGIPCGIFTFTQPKRLFKNKIPPCAIAATTLVLTARCSGRNSDTLFFCRRSPRAASSPSFFHAADFRWCTETKQGKLRLSCA